MKYIDEYRDTNEVKKIADKIIQTAVKPINIMEVCGGHTMAIRKNALERIVGDKVRFISGPGCPVCVTSIKDIDKIMYLALNEDVVICSFGDLYDVPGSRHSLSGIKALGKDIRMVYSVADVIKYAQEEKNKKFIFVSIGFETTTPGTAAAICEVKNKGIDNFYVLCLNKTMPAALKAVLSNKRSRVDALLCPGHVSTITGSGIYSSIVNDLGVSCCIAGFEPVDLLNAVYVLVKSNEENKPVLFNAYERVVHSEGNLKALDIMNKVFESASADWRGLGIVPDSGLKIRNTFSELDAEKVFKIKIKDAKEKQGCICGDILIGASDPKDCPSFGKTCTPETPIGACMVSSEGACAAWYKYRVL
ncbi:MAG: hydrogenase formation protein HypD [Candidatus Omnitrophica bacterium]|nr:hydrogenase formation protein HypD [Candidatus Omnitrophota bacterium]